MPVPSIAFTRLAQQQISRQRFQTPAEVVGWLGAMQGQDYAGAKWSVGLRLPGSSDAAIEQAIADRLIVRTWLLRGTLHLVAAADIRWLLALVAPRLIAGSARRHRELELDAPTLARSETILMNALAEHGTRMRAELLAALEQQGISTQGQRGYHILRHVSLNGRMCQGSATRSEPNFVALDAVAPLAGALPPAAALAELARRYFLSRGPATLADFIAWSDLTAGDARVALEAVQPEIEQQQIDGQVYWFAPAASAPDQPPAYALPGFDEYLLGYRDRSAVLPPEYAQRVCPGGNGVFQPTIVIQGQVVGTWKRTLKKDRLIIEVAPFAAFTPSEMDAFADAVTRYGAFCGLPATVSPLGRNL